MRFLGAVVILFLAVVPLSAQYWATGVGVGGFGNIVFPALGHAPAGPHPYGNVISPAIPNAGLVPGFRSSNGFGRGPGYGNGYGRRRANTSGIYAYPVFIGGYGPAYGNGYAPPDQPSDAPPAAQSGPPPVVINQYFGTPPPDQAPPPDSANSNFHYYQAPANTEAAAPADSSYYLIAFKDHTVYSAVAYYVDGDTLHYFTIGNVHNQVSLSLVDRQLTEQLNRQHNVEVRLPQ